MRRMPVGVGPSFLPLPQGFAIGQSLVCDQTLQRRQPMFVVVSAVVGLAVIRRCFQLRGQFRRPFFPSEVTLFGEGRAGFLRRPCGQ